MFCFKENQGSKINTKKYRRSPIWLIWTSSSWKIKSYMEDIQKWHPWQILYFPISIKYILITYTHKEQQSLSSNKFSDKKS